MADSHDPASGWRKSIRSVHGSNNCVEVMIVSGAVMVRDSKNPGADVLTFFPMAWRNFLAALAGGDIREPDLEA